MLVALTVAAALPGSKFDGKFHQQLQVGVTVQTFKKFNKGGGRHYIVVLRRVTAASDFKHKSCDIVCLLLRSRHSKKFRVNQLLSSVLYPLLCRSDFSSPALSLTFRHSILVLACIPHGMLGCRRYGWFIGPYLDVLSATTCPGPGHQSSVLCGNYFLVPTFVGRSPHHTATGMSR